MTQDRPTGGPANVGSTEAVGEFAAALAVFEDEARNVLLAMDQQVKRAEHWIENEAPALWRQRIRAALDDVDRTRSAWDNCRMRVVAGHVPACIEEEQAHRAARRRLELANQKPALLRQWSMRLRREIDEYRSRIGRLSQTLDGDLPRTRALLERTTAALDAYLEGPPPDGDR